MTRLEVTLAKSLKTSFEPAEFINVPLSAEQKAELRAWLPDFGEIDDALLKTCESGYKITLRFDDRNECFACWLSPVDPGNANTGLILSGRGSTPLKAVKQALYIHNRLFEGDWAGNYKDYREAELDD